MDYSNGYLIITTINPVTEAVNDFLNLPNIKMIVVADQKTPDLTTDLPKDYADFYSLEHQLKDGFQLYSQTPWNHYCRKNLGYLSAIKKGASLIAETDDDNQPYSGWGDDVQLGYCRGIQQVEGERAFNVYSLFTDEFVWPRGFPLDALHSQSKAKLVRGDANILVWQGLADLDPDVDAIYRLIFNTKSLKFNRLQTPVVLDEGVYCPFNSQNTFWSERAFPYLYLPMFVSFRFTDILRGYIAQRGLWALGGRLAFGNASVYQIRNVHNLLTDFTQELEVYTRTNQVIDILDTCQLTGSPQEDLLTMYEALHSHGVVEDRELSAVNAWLADIYALGVITSA